MLCVFYHSLHVASHFFAALLTRRVFDNCVTGAVPTIERRYRAQQMALWLDLIPRLHQAPNLGPANFSSDACYHQLDDSDRDSTFEPHAARVWDPECDLRKETLTGELPVGVTSFSVVTRPSRKHVDHRRTTRSHVTPRYRMVIMIWWSGSILSVESN